MMEWRVTTGKGEPHEKSSSMRADGDARRRVCTCAGGRLGRPAPELDFSKYPRVDANRYVSYNYDNNGRAFFRAAGFYCSIGQYPGRVACKGSVATAPHGSQGAAQQQPGPMVGHPHGHRRP